MGGFSITSTQVLQLHIPNADISLNYFFSVLSVKYKEGIATWFIFLHGAGTVGFSEDLGVDRHSQLFKIHWALSPYICWDSVLCVHPQGYRSRSHKPLCLCARGLGSSLALGSVRMSVGAVLA